QGTANSIKPSIKKEVYVLFGAHSCGKSSTMKEIYRILSIKYPNCIIHNKGKKCGYDMRIKMRIKVKTKVGIEDVLVGIDTHGDIKNHVKESLEHFVKNNCNVIFCVESIKNFVQLANSSAQNINHILKNTAIGKLPILKQYKMYPLSVLYLQNKAKAIKKNNTEAGINYEIAKIIINQAGL
ncbi:MAG: hypothetical protein FWF63_09545, partial [Fibromonadales bacterium]|nr:hypothetical protein [Fibromonadales bacterium]